MEWTRTYIDNSSMECYGLKQTFDGGYVFTGRIEGVFNTRGYRIFLVKTDVTGQKQWERLYGREGHSIYGSDQVIQASDSGFLILGTVAHFDDPTTRGGLYLVRTDKDGNALWEKTLTDFFVDCGLDAIELPGGDFMVTGYAGNMKNGTVFLAKVSDSGDLRWIKSYSSGGTDYGNCLKPTADGGFIIGGFSQFGGDRDVSVFKTDAEGDLQWYRTFGDDRDEGCISIEQTKDGGFILTGFNCSYGIGGIYAYVIKIDASGNEQWSGVGGSGYEEGLTAREQDGGYLVTGHTRDSQGDGWFARKDLCFIKFNDTGVAQWEKSLGEPIPYTPIEDYRRCDDCLFTVATADGGHAIGGSRYNSSTLKCDLFLVKVSEVDPSKLKSLPPAPTVMPRRPYVPGSIPRTIGDDVGTVLLRLFRSIIGFILRFINITMEPAFILQ